MNVPASIERSNQPKRRSSNLTPQATRRQQVRGTRGICDNMNTAVKTVFVDKTGNTIVTCCRCSHTSWSPSPAIQPPAERRIGPCFQAASHRPARPFSGQAKSDVRHQLSPLSNSFASSSRRTSSPAMSGFPSQIRFIERISAGMSSGFFSNKWCRMFRISR